MEQRTLISDVELGRFLASVREKAGLRQHELAKRVTWSPAVLSRVEAGNRSLSEDELAGLLDAIGTKDALRLREVLHRSWTVLPRPPIGHENEDLLWEAESALQEIAALAEQPDLKAAFARRLSEYRGELTRSATLLLQTEAQVAFVGSIGVGKSTALCSLLGLDVASPASQYPLPVLETGAGGITICEVHIRQGPDYGLIIEPRTDEQVRRDVADFAEFISLAAGTVATEDQDLQEGDSLSISKEIARAIRNMAGFRIRREKGPDGRRVSRDDARNLAVALNDTRSLAVEILARMNLHRRDRRDIWYSQSVGTEPLSWLREQFELVNNGRHPDFSLPQRIEVVVPRSILDLDLLRIRLIDTKGIDQTAERADLEHLFDEPHTVSILCSLFNEAPALATQQLLNRAIEGGVRDVPLKAAILVLPRPGEALAAKDDEGFVVDTVDAGYELKREQVEMRLQQLGLATTLVAFFNVREESSSSLQDFILGRIAVLRDSYRSRLDEIITGAHAVVANYQKAQVHEVQREAVRHLRVWLTANQELPQTADKFHEPLMAALQQAHPSTVRATIRRQGEWPNLEYAHQLGYGARRTGAVLLKPKAAGFAAIAENLLNDPQLADAAELVRQARRILESGVEEALRKIQLLGQANYLEGVKIDQAFWQQCDSEWGAGPGYRDRVSGRNREWFEAEDHAAYQVRIMALIGREWTQMVLRLTGLLDLDDVAAA